MEGLLQRVAIPPVLRGFASPAPANQAFEVHWQQGRITRIVHGPVGAEVTVAVAGGAEIVSVITASSAHDLA